MKTAKPISVQKVTAILRKAGYRRSEYGRATNVRGLRHSTRGYRTSKLGDGRVRVEHFTGDFISDRDAQQAALESYRDVLLAAGLSAEIDGHKVIVEAQP